MIDSRIPQQISGVKFTDASLIVSLADGREIATPLSWYPRLAAAPEERDRWEITPLGLHWATLDEDLSLAGMFAGQNSVGSVPLKSSLSPISLQIDKKSQKWSFVYGNVVTDYDKIPMEILDRLHHDIETAIDDR